MFFCVSLCFKLHFYNLAFVVVSAAAAAGSAVIVFMVLILYNKNAWQFPGWHDTKPHVPELNCSAIYFYILYIFIFDKQQL